MTKQRSKRDGAANQAVSERIWNRHKTLIGTCIASTPARIRLSALDKGDRTAPASAIWARLKSCTQALAPPPPHVTCRATQVPQADRPL